MYHFMSFWFITQKPFEQQFYIIDNNVYKLYMGKSYYKNLEIKFECLKIL